MQTPVTPPGGASATVKGQGRPSVPDEEDFTFPHRMGVTCVRGGEVFEILDEAGKSFNDMSGKVRGPSFF
jgi:hypothetical protein